MVVTYLFKIDYYFSFISVVKYNDAKAISFYILGSETN